MTGVQPSGTVVTEITIQASPARIFRALTDPSELPLWWGEEGMYRCTHMERDLRVGGKYKTSGAGADGKQFTVSGEYREVDPPRLLSYTWNYDWDTNVTTTLVRFELIERGDETLVRVTHSGFISEAPRADHGKGWVRVLGWLRGYVERPDQRAG
jgi:uncharacterized protein YndB with AHSA1/START domain